MRSWLWLGLIILASEAKGFGGFHAVKSGAEAFAPSSHVIIVRDGNRTVMTLASGFTGPSENFAVIVPVPGALEAHQVHVGDASAVAHLDAYTAPRLEAYYDENPCNLAKGLRGTSGSGAEGRKPDVHLAAVSAPADYHAGDYDISIVTGRESASLAAKMQKQGYSLSREARTSAARYATKGYSFVVAKVKPAAGAPGAKILRPLQVAFESPTFVLPLRAAHAGKKDQDLVIQVLTRGKSVEAANYEMKNIPDGVALPEFAADAFPEVYRTVFDRLTHDTKKAAVFTEYSQDLNWCLPCTAEPLTVDELRGLGVFWVKARRENEPLTKSDSVVVTRLRMRYDGSSLPEDLELRVTEGMSPAQVRYTVRHPFTGEADCPRVDTYRKELAEKEKTQAEKLAELTGWSLEDVRRKMKLPGDSSETDEDWIKNLWND